MAPAPTLLQVYREALASRHYARRTVDAYERWLRRFLRFHRRHVLKVDPGDFDGVVRARRPKRMPVVLGVAEVRAVLQQLEGPAALVCGLLYGGGLRLMEALRLRVQELDFASHEVVIRGGKGNKDRLTVLPQNLMHPLQIHLQDVKRLHRQDLAAGWGQVPLPGAWGVST